MKYETCTFIEVKNAEHLWAVEIADCKQEMKPVTPLYISVGNEIYTDIIYIVNTLSDTIPETIIDGINGSVSDNYIDVGFWKIKYKNIN